MSLGMVPEKVGGGSRASNEPWATMKSTLPSPEASAYSFLHQFKSIFGFSFSQAVVLVYFQSSRGSEVA